MQQPVCASSPVNVAAAVSNSSFIPNCDHQPCELVREGGLDVSPLPARGVVAGTLARAFTASSKCSSSCEEWKCHVRASECARARACE